MTVKIKPLEIFSFLATTVVESIDCSKQIISTHRTEVLCNQSRDVSGLAPRADEEADTWIILDLEDAVKEENTIVSIRTVDTDVVVLAMTSAQRLNNTEIWIAFGNRKCFRFIPVHEIARALGLIGVWHYQCSTDTVSICKRKR